MAKAKGTRILNVKVDRAGFITPPIRFGTYCFNTVVQLRLPKSAARKAAPRKRK
jgi:hypothetical protein